MFKGAGTEGKQRNAIEGLVKAKTEGLRVLSLCHEGCYSSPSTKDARVPFSFLTLLLGGSNQAVRGRTSGESLDNKNAKSMGDIEMKSHVESTKPVL